MPTVSGKVVLPDGTEFWSDEIELEEIRSSGRLGEWRFSLSAEGPSPSALVSDGTCRLCLDDGREGDCFWVRIGGEMIEFQGTGPLERP